MADGTGLVRGYYRHVGGKLVSVHAYHQSDTGSLVSTDASILAGVLTRPFLTAKPGMFTHGLVPIALFPQDRDVPFAPTQLWVRKGNPMQGLGGVGLSAKLTSTELIFLTGNAAEEWTIAIQEGLAHVKLVVSNNPDKDMIDILSRPDVQEALQAAGDAGARATSEVINDIWKKENAPEDSPYLTNILNDVQRNALTFANRMTTALQSVNKDKVESVILKDRLRAAAAQSVAETRAKMEVAQRIYKLANIKYVQWKANYHNNTPCFACNALNGTVVKLGSQFDVSLLGKLKPYRDLIGPPAHPKCSCRLVPVKR